MCHNGILLSGRSTCTTEGINRLVHKWLPDSCMWPHAKAVLLDNITATLLLKPCCTGCILTSLHQSRRHCLQKVQYFGYDEECINDLVLLQHVQQLSVALGLQMPAPWLDLTAAPVEPLSEAVMMLLCSCRQRSMPTTSHWSAWQTSSRQPLLLLPQRHLQLQVQHLLCQSQRILPQQRLRWLSLLWRL